MSKMEEVVRPVESPATRKGHRVPSTAGINPDAAVGEYGGGETPAQDPRIVRNDQAIDFAFWPIYGAAIAGSEDLTAAKSVSGSIEIPLNVSNLWELDVVSDGLTVTFGDFPDLPDELSRSIYATRTRGVQIELVLTWRTASTERTVTLSGVRFANGTAPSWSQLAGGVDVLIIQKLSSGLLLGFHAGPDMKVPT